MEKEIAVMVFFAVLAVVTHFYKLKHENAHMAVITSAPIITHPVVFDTVRDYMIHFVVYSGYIFGH